MRKKVRQGARNTFTQKAGGLLFSFTPGTPIPRKTMTTKATFVTVMTLGVISGLGTVMTIADPQAMGQQKGLDQYLTGTFGVMATYGMYKAADDMANNWWVTER